MAFEPEDFYVGQRVRFRQWDDMAEEFGARPDGCIRTRPLFNNGSMKEMCGTEATIADIRYDGRRDNVSLTDFEYNGSTHWVYSTQMIEPVYNDIGTDFDSRAFHSMLGI